MLLFKKRFFVGKNFKLDPDVSIYALPSPDNVAALVVCANLVCV